MKTATDLTALQLFHALAIQRLGEAQGRLLEQEIAISKIHHNGPDLIAAKEVLVVLKECEDFMFDQVQYLQQLILEEENGSPTIDIEESDSEEPGHPRPMLTSFDLAFKKHPSRTDGSSC